MVVVARAEGWTANDLAWSLWSSILVIGSTFILLACLSMPVASLFIKDKGKNSSFGNAVTVSALILVFIGGVFLVFHYGHSVFLRSFLPPFAESAGADLARNNSPAATWRIAVLCVRSYWRFIVVSAVLQVVSMVMGVRSGDGSALMRPITNVVKMHMLIMVFTMLDIINARAIALYVGLFMFYFPFGVKLGGSRERGGTGGAEEAEKRT